MGSNHRPLGYEPSELPLLYPTMFNCLLRKDTNNISNYQIFFIFFYKSLKINELDYQP